jgi:hypothetical protein
MFFPSRGRHLFSSALVGWTLCCFVACAPVCQRTCTEGAPIQGTLQIDYDGAIGHAPPSELDMRVVTQAEDGVLIQGCGCVDDRFWRIEFSASRPARAPTPLLFNNSDPNAAWATAFLMSCEPDSCYPERLRTFFASAPSATADATGQLLRFDPFIGSFAADLTLTNTAPYTREFGTFHIYADLTWASTVIPSSDAGSEP